MSVGNADRRVFGFIGCGKISSALCRGFATHPDPSRRPQKILVSRRSEGKSKKLEMEFPQLVEVIDSNEDIVRESSVVFIGLLPVTARELLPVLPFTNNHLVISMMAAVDFETTKSLLPSNSIPLVRIVPLPSSARRSGPILLYPPHQDAQSILSIVGTPIVCTSEFEMKPMIAVTGHISSFYELMRTTETFIIGNGVATPAAHSFVTSFYSSLATGAEQSADSLEELRDEAATPGGLNEESIRRLKASSHFELQTNSLESILNRLNR